MNTYYLIVSDLHLGASGPLEDFLVWTGGNAGPDPRERPTLIERLGRHFLRFLLEHLARAAFGGWAPHLILLGDALDLWQTLLPEEKPANALVRTLEHHPYVVAALRRWVAEGGRLTYVLGNHDQPLVDPEAWALIQEILPMLNASTGGGPIHYFADSTCGLYAEHGHQWDPMNRLRALHRWDADCPGRRIVRELVNRLEPSLPLLDKGADLKDLLEQLFHLDPQAGRPLWQEAAHVLLRLVGRAAGPARALAEEITGWLDGADRQDRPPDFRRIAQRQLALQDRALRRAIHPRPGGTIGPLPAGVRYIASGHTHRPCLAQIAAGGRFVTHLNPGTWRPVLSETPEGPPRVVQQYTAIVLRPGEGGEPQAGLMEWPMGTEETVPEEGQRS